ncbi:MAG: hypothetical protein H0V68_00505 [Actinobacteria bacterium]|nr:hypothetical protein [Actinomycetota bacterium]
MAPVLGIAARPDGRGILAWFDPISLKTLPGRKAPLGTHRGAWSFSHDRSVLAIADYKKSELRFIDARRMRVLGDLRLSGGGTAWLLSWVRPDRLLAVVGGEQATQLVVVNPRTRAVVRRTELPPGPVWSSATTGVTGGLVLLLGADGAFEPTRVAVVDADGGVRVATVSQILIGTVWKEREGESPVGDIRQPGLAVDPSGGRAFLIGAGAPVAEIDLATLDVSYHEVSEPISLLGRLRHWLEPAAQAKVLTGPTRYARWVSDDLIAVAGSDRSTWKDAQGKEQYRARAAGVRLIDTRTWTVRTLNADATSFQTGSGVVFAMGGSWDSSTQTRDGVGIAAYDLNGRERYRLHTGENVWLNVAASLGYIYLGGEGERVEIVDLATGAILRRLDRVSSEAWPDLLAASGSVP